MAGAPYKSNKDDGNEIKKIEANLSRIHNIEDVIRRLFAEYLGNPVVRDVVQKFGGDIGILVDTISAYFGHKFAGHRLVECLAILLDELNQLTLDKLDREFLETEEFYDIFQKVLVFFSSITGAIFSFSFRLLTCWNCLIKSI